MATSSDSAQQTLLTGTPVVPGVAYAPALVVRAEVSPDAIARFDGSALDEDAALAAYDDAVAAVADGFAAKADKVSGAAAEVLTASAGLARDKGLRGAVRKSLRSGDDLLAAVQAGVEQFVNVFTGMGGLMAERVTDLRDIERRVVARLVGEPEPGVPEPDVPSVLVAEDLAPSDTAGLQPSLVVALVTERGGPTSHTAIIARQLGIPCVVGTHGAMTVQPGTRLLVDGTSGSVEIDPDAEEAERRVASTRRPGRRSPHGRARVRPPTTSRSRSSPTSPTASPPAPPPTPRWKASACSAPSSASSTARRSRAQMSRPRSTARC